MFKFTAMQAARSSEFLALDTRVPFDDGLLARLIAGHGELNARFAALLCSLEDDPQAAVCAIRDCASQLHELRRTEALWLYPVIARGVEYDEHARRQLVRLRLVMVALTRRLVRRLEELLQAVVSGSATRAAADEISATLSEYVERNEGEIYPLYRLIGMPLGHATPRVA
ncbi:MAG TPA: hypothetical protein VFI49_08510 [Rudaea sp.]|nr:hypothetical protein [Rudaea sp.]